jgi:hypothetical protein
VMVRRRDADCELRYLPQATEEDHGVPSFILEMETCRGDGHDGQRRPSGSACDLRPSTFLPVSARFLSPVSSHSSIVCTALATYGFGLTACAHGRSYTPAARPLGNRRDPAISARPETAGAALGAATTGRPPTPRLAIPEIKRCALAP